MTDAFTAGQKLTAAFLNNLFKGSAGWIPYTPVLGSASGTPPTIGNGTLTGRYAENGREGLVQISFVPGSTTTYGSAGAVWTWSLPPALVYNSLAIKGQASIVDISAGQRYNRSPVPFGAGAIHLTSEAGVNVTNAAPMTWATGDTCNIAIDFEATT